MCRKAKLKRYKHDGRTMLHCIISILNCIQGFPARSVACQQVFSKMYLISNIIVTRGNVSEYVRKKITSLGPYEKQA